MTALSIKWFFPTSVLYEWQKTVWRVSFFLCVPGRAPSTSSIFYCNMILKNYEIVINVEKIMLHEAQMRGRSNCSWRRLNSENFSVAGKTETNFPCTLKIIRIINGLRVFLCRLNGKEFSRTSWKFIGHSIITVTFAIFPLSSHFYVSHKSKVQLEIKWAIIRPHPSSRSWEMMFWRW